MNPSSLCLATEGVHQSSPLQSILTTKARARYIEIGYAGLNGEGGSPAEIRLWHGSLSVQYTEPS